MTMIDPTDVTKFDRTETELQEYLLFCIAVAGKTAKTQAKLLEAFLSSLRSRYGELSPFALIKKSKTDGKLLDDLKNSKLGQFNRMVKSFDKATEYENKLSNITVSELESIPGIGPKTSRFFLLHSRENQVFAVLDTHVLHYMRDQGLTSFTSTPSKKDYLSVEQIFLNHAKTINKTIADLDLEIWTKYSGTTSNKQ